MDKRKILIITHGFYPEQSPRSFRATELTKEFCRQGHYVTVMAPYRQGTDILAKEYGFHFRSLGTLNWRIFNFHNFGKLGRIYNKAVNRLLPLLFEYPMMELFFKIKKTLDKDVTKYDLLITIAVPYPIHWGVASLWKKYKINIAKKWIADCGDPYCLQENDTFRPPFYFRWVEKWFMRKTDFITVPTINSCSAYFPEFQNKLRVIPQGFRFEDIEIRSTKDDGVIRFGYGGVFIPNKRDPREFITFLISLPESVNFEFHVYTATPQLISPHIYNDKRIFINNPVNRKNLLETLSAFQFVVNFANRGASQTPSKLIDYMIIEKPILNIETGNLDTNIIKEFLQGDYSNALKIEDSEKYKIENVVQSFMQLI